MILRLSIFRTFCLPILLLKCAFTYAQVDSLEQKLNTTVNSDTRTLLLFEIGDYYLKRNPRKGAEYYQQALELSQKNRKRNAEYRALKSIGTVHFYLSEFDSCSLFWNKALNAAPRDSFKLRADIYNNLGALYVRSGEPDSSAYYHKLALRMRTAQKDSLGIANSNNNLGIHYRQSGDYDLALSYYLKALRMYTDLNRSKERSDVLNGIGLLYINLKEYDEAHKYLKKALEIREKLGNPLLIVQVLHNIGVVYYSKSDFITAEKYYLRFLAYSESVQDKRSRAGVLNNLGIIYNNRGESEKALKYYLEAYEIFQPMNDVQSFTKLCINIGLLYRDAENYDESIVFMERALEHVQNADQNDLKKRAFQGLAEAHELKKDYKNAYKYFVQYAKIKDTIFSQELSDNIAKYEAKYQLVAKARKIEKLNHKVSIKEKEAQLARSFRNGLIISSSLIFILLLLLLNRYRLRKKVHQQEQRILTEEKEKYRLETEVKNQQLQNKSIELSSLTMNAIHKNELLMNMADQLEETRKENPEISDALSQIERTIKGGLNMDADWDNFQKHFNGVHPDFFTTLKISFDSLTRNDLRNCAYIRMGLSDKEVSILMNIAPKSVKMNRYRLKKKLGLSENDSISSFLHSI